MEVWWDSGQSYLRTELARGVELEIYGGQGINSLSTYKASLGQTKEGVTIMAEYRWHWARLRFEFVVKPMVFDNWLQTFPS